MPQGSRGTVARIVAGAAVPLTGALGWTVDRARAAGGAFASASQPVMSSCAAATLGSPTASVASFGVTCPSGVTSSLQGAWSHLQEVEATETRAVRAAAPTRAQTRAAEKRAQARAAKRKAERAKAERRAARLRVERRVAERRARERQVEARRKAAQANAKRKAAQQAAKRTAAKRTGWRNAPIVTWYGPGFYGNRTACGVRYTRKIVGVAHRTLPCGTLVEFKWHGITAVAPVIDRGPFASSAYVFDFSAALACDVFKPRKVDNACFTRYDVKYRVVGRVALKSYLRRQ
ncbi:MAG: septal ring lytic transglycosylase RlpA family protein [Chloroflexota bacterium]